MWKFLSKCIELEGSEIELRMCVPSVFLSQLFSCAVWYFVMSNKTSICHDVPPVEIGSRWEKGGGGWVKG